MGFKEYEQNKIVEKEKMLAGSIKSQCTKDNCVESWGKYKHYQLSSGLHVYADCNGAEHFADSIGGWASVFTEPVPQDEYRDDITSKISRFKGCKELSEGTNNSRWKMHGAPCFSFVNGEIAPTFGIDMPRHTVHKDGTLAESQLRHENGKTTYTRRVYKNSNYYDEQIVLGEGNIDSICDNINESHEFDDDGLVCVKKSDLIEAVSKLQTLLSKEMEKITTTQLDVNAERTAKIQKIIEDLDKLNLSKQDYEELMKQLEERGRAAENNTQDLENQAETK